MKKLLTALSLTTLMATPMITSDVNAKTSSLPDKSVIGADERTMITDTTKNPYQSIVSLIQTYGEDEYICTGTVIAKNKVITAAHCIYDAAKGGYPDSVSLTPGRNNTAKPFGTFEGTWGYVPSGWSSYKDTNNDIAIIDVAPNASGQNIGEVVTQQRLAQTTSYTGKKITITGYPGDKTATYGLTQWTHSSPVISQTGSKFSYATDTYGGQSGSAVFDNATGNIIGIHTSGSATANFATQLNSTNYKWVQDTLKLQNGQSPYYVKAVDLNK